jgi:hypothetical protein
MRERLVKTNLIAYKNKARFLTSRQYQYIGPTYHKSHVDYTDFRMTDFF